MTITVFAHTSSICSIDTRPHPFARLLGYRSDSFVAYRDGATWYDDRTRQPVSAAVDAAIRREQRLHPHRAHLELVR